MNDLICEEHQSLTMHPSYQNLVDIQSLRTFMETHIFAVWDFMSLLKSLQNKVTCTTIPWSPSSYSSQTVRLVNQIVLEEESDIDAQGNATSHFELYINAMKEVGANIDPILNFIHDLNYNELPDGIRDFVSYHIELSTCGEAHQIAGSFFYGREKVLPDIFNAILKIVEKNNLDCPSLIYYFKRHIELDGESHGPLAEKCLNDLCSGDPIKLKESYEIGLHSLKLRSKLWDSILTP